jgi:hypothetical protein
MKLTLTFLVALTVIAQPLSAANWNIADWAGTNVVSATNAAQLAALTGLFLSSSAGTMASRSTNDFALATDARIILAVTNLSSVISTNVPGLKGFVSGNSLTNSFSTNADGTVTPNVGIPFQPATNNPASSTNIFVTAVSGITNNLGYVTNLTVTLGTNIINYQQR